MSDEDRARSIAAEFGKRHDLFYERLLSEARRLGNGMAVIGDYYNGAGVNLYLAVIKRYLEVKYL